MSMDASAVTSASAGAKAIARSEIENLRRWYARATDMLGVGSPESIAEARAIYHRIFTPNAQLKTRSLDGSGFTAEGPDEWVDVCVDALADYNATQHLIGTQLVSLQTWEENAAGELQHGSATMTSYLQAWHSTPENRLWLFMGTYEDKIVYTAENGWQIVDMVLIEVSSDERVIQPA